MIYSKKLVYCNNCSAPIFKELPNVIGRNWRVCSTECLKDINVKETESIMNISSNGKIITEEILSFISQNKATVTQVIEHFMKLNHSKNEIKSALSKLWSEGFFNVLNNQVLERVE